MQPRAQGNEYLLQKRVGTLFVLHIPKRKSSDVGGTGHILEGLSCPDNSNLTHFSIGRFLSGGKRLHIVSEVDGFDAATGR